MIKKLILNNFQSHKKTILDFDPGFNAIAGQSESGKTSILRALGWVIFNRPGGDAFRSLWGGETFVNIKMDGIDGIKRIKDDKINKYSIGKQEWTTPGTSVPEDIQCLINMKEINFQKQFSMPFLLFESPGERARIINEIAQMELIDKVQSNINKMDLTCGNDLRAGQKNIEGMEEEIKKYEKVEKLVGEINKITVLFEELEKIEKVYIEAKAKIKYFKYLQEEESSYKELEIEDGLRLVESILRKEKEVNEKREYLNQIKDKNNTLQIWKKKIEATGQRIKEMGNRLSQLIGKTCPFCNQSLPKGFLK